MVSLLKEMVFLLLFFLISLVSTCCSCGVDESSFKASYQTLLHFEELCTSCHGDDEFWGRYLPIITNDFPYVFWLGVMVDPNILRSEDIID